jgi:homoserine kinase
MSAPVPITVTVRVPGTTANLGPGFDCLGLALKLYNQVRVTRVSGRAVTITSPIDADTRPGATAMLETAAACLFRRSRRAAFGFEISITGAVPLARGLGSSVTARLGCVAGLNALLGEPLDRAALLEVVTELEGHPDNAAPAVYGGFTVAGMVGKTVRVQRFKVSPKATFVTLIPDFEVPTPEARKLVPATFSKADTVHSLGRAALIASAFATGKLEELRGLFDDRIHQPYREPLIPQLSKVIAAGEKAGAVGGWLSGSGSTIICLSLGEAQTAESVGRAMRRQLPGATVHLLGADPTGFKLIQTTRSKA